MQGVGRGALFSFFSFARSQIPVIYKVFGGVYALFSRRRELITAKAHDCLAQCYIYGTSKNVACLRTWP